MQRSRIVFLSLSLSSFFPLLYALPTQAAPTDSDGDGVLDSLDILPCDATVVSQQAFPALGTFATIAFEDQWPSLGDFDFNDLVVDHNTEIYKNAAGQTTRLRLTYHPRAMGAAFDNGFAVHLPVALASVAGVQINKTVKTGVGTTVTSIAPKSDESDLVVVVSDNVRSELFGNAAGQVNTNPAAGVLDASTIIIDVTFASGIALDGVLAPFDVFLFRSGEYGHQIHLPQFAGTSLMRQDLFASLDDGSSAAQSRFFVDKRGIPFALSLPTTAAHTQEGKRFDVLYPRVVDFAASNGTLFTNFFSVDINAALAYNLAIAPSTHVAINIDESCIAGECTPYSVVDFEGFASGTVISNQYEADGVLISSTNSSTPPKVVIAGGSLVGFGSTSGDNKPMFQGTGGLYADNSTGSDYVFDFTVPTDEVKLQIMDLDGVEKWTVTAFDGATAVASVTKQAGQSDTGDGKSTEFVVRASRITRVVVDQVNSAGHAIDFLVFKHPCQTDVPALIAQGSSCLEILQNGLSTGDGVYVLDPDGTGPNKPFETFCDMTTDGGGWTLFARTVASGLTDEEKDLIRLSGLSRYGVNGYGDPRATSRIFWNALDNWSSFTSTFPQNVFWSRTQTSRDVQVTGFLIGNSASRYTMTWTGDVAGYNEIGEGSGDHTTSSIKGRAFTTLDQDNDTQTSGVNCALNNVGTNGGFWYSNCTQFSMLHADGNLYDWNTNVGAISGSTLGLVVPSNEIYLREKARNGNIPFSCKDALTLGLSTGNGLYTIDADGTLPNPPMTVFCDMTTDGGGWTLLARTVLSGLTTAEKDTIRKSGISIYGTTGYGSADAASRIYWLPLDVWNLLTTTFPNNQMWVQTSNSSLDVKNKNIQVGNFAAKYPLSWSGGVAGFNQLGQGSSDHVNINGRKFTAFDSDNDSFSGNCAKDNVGVNGGFWYTQCTQFSMLHNDSSIYAWKTNPGALSGASLANNRVQRLEIWFKED